MRRPTGRGQGAVTAKKTQADEEAGGEEEVIRSGHRVKEGDGRAEEREKKHQIMKKKWA